MGIAEFILSTAEGLHPSTNYKPTPPIPQIYCALGFGRVPIFT